MSITTIIVVAFVIYLLAGPHHSQGTTHKPTHGSTVCTQYFKAGC